MSEELRNQQREGYANQLRTVDEELTNLEQKRNQLVTQREQLKGAIFALDTLLASEQQAKKTADKKETKKKG